MRSTRIALAGAAILCAGSFVLMVALPRLEPLETVRCVPPGEALCSSGINAAYPVAFLFSVAGAVVVFYGVFGRGFVANPVFVAGMIALAYGLSGMASAVLDTQRAANPDPGIFAPLVVIGALAIWFQAYRRQRRGEP